MGVAVDPIVTAAQVLLMSTTIISRQVDITKAPAGRQLWNC